LKGLLRKTQKCLDRINRIDKITTEFEYGFNKQRSQRIEIAVEVVVVDQKPKVLICEYRPACRQAGVICVIRVL
jgi:hypothetical protein